MNPPIYTRLCAERGSDPLADRTSTYEIRGYTGELVRAVEVFA